MKKPATSPHAAFFVFPTYNEEKNINRVLGEFAAHFTDPAFRFVVVINNTIDRTLLEAKKAAKRDRRIIIHDLSTKVTGKGGAILHGWRNFDDSTPLVGFIDADGSVTPKDTQLLLEAISKSPEVDLAISSRWKRGAVMNIKQSALRQLLSRMFNLTVRVMFLLPYADTQCGAKVMRAEALQKILPQLQETGFAFDIDLLWQAKRSNLKVVEVPIHWHDTPHSSVQPLKIVKPLLKALVTIRMRQSKPVQNRQAVKKG